MNEQILEELLKLYVEQHNMFAGLTKAQLNQHCTGNESDVINERLGHIITMIVNLIDKVNGRPTKLIKRAYPFEITVSDIKDLLNNRK